MWNIRWSLFQILGMISYLYRFLILKWMIWGYHHFRKPPIWWYLMDDICWSNFRSHHGHQHVKSSFCFDLAQVLNGIDHIPNIWNDTYEISVDHCFIELAAKGKLKPENPIFGGNHGFRFRFSLKPIHWLLVSTCSVLSVLSVSYSPYKQNGLFRNRLIGGTHRIFFGLCFRWRRL